MSAEATPQSGSRIVVGVDGSSSSLQALRWAMQQARRTGDEVHAVISWMPPTTYGWALGTPDIDWPANARQVLDDALASTVTAEEAAGMHRHVIRGHPAQALLDAADGAELLVVGSRGHGGFGGMLLGSVSQHVIAHSPCPVVVIRDADGPRSENAAPR